MSTEVSEPTVLDEVTWQALEHGYRERVEPWVAERRRRRSRGEAHPVDDFLFDYYPYSVGRLTTWHPGHGVVLRGGIGRFLDHPDYVPSEGGATTSVTRLERHRARLAVASRLLSVTSAREPQLGCFGLHEWAMVYRQSPDQVRHTSYPLRLAPGDIAEVVQGVGLRCTHIDAYRFFTPEAVPLNAHIPTREAQHEFEQPGCLHANMDLYKYAQWFSPFVGSDLVADCFALARDARELDMRAAPYDLSGLGYAPITIETPEGRREYTARQRGIADRAAVLRSRLLDDLDALGRLAATRPEQQDDYCDGEQHAAGDQHG